MNVQQKRRESRVRGVAVRWLLLLRLPRGGTLSIAAFLRASHLQRGSSYTCHECTAVLERRQSRVRKTHRVNPLTHQASLQTWSKYAKQGATFQTWKTFFFKRLDCTMLCRGFQGNSRSLLRQSVKSIYQ